MVMVHCIKLQIDISTEYLCGCWRFWREKIRKIFLGKDTAGRLCISSNVDDHMILAGRCFTVTDHDDDDVRRRIKDDVPCLHAIAIAPLPFPSP